MQAPVETVDPWTLNDGPYIKETRNLKLFLAYLKSPSATGYEISRVAPYVVVLRAFDGFGSSVVYEAHTSGLSQGGREELYAALTKHPARMAKLHREWLATQIAAFFSL